MKNFILPTLLILAFFLFPQIGLVQTINELSCINAKVSDPFSFSDMRRFNYVRYYHDWTDDMPNDDDNQGSCLEINTPSDWNFKWNPSFNQSGSFLNYDDFLGQLQGRAIPSLKGINQWYRGWTSFPGIQWVEQKPICPNTPYDFNQQGFGLSGYAYQNAMDQLPSPTEQHNPSVFEGRALWVSMFAARFGGSAIPTATLDDYTLDPLPISLSPKIQYIELNNEQNKSWLDWAVGIQTYEEYRDGKTLFYFSPKQYGASFKADYDGDGGTMQLAQNNQALGVINTSLIPPENIAMGGLTGLGGAYLNEMGVEDYTYIANFHHYCNNKTAEQENFADFTAAIPGQAPTGEFGAYHTILFDLNGEGVHPEKDLLKEKLGWTVGGIQNSGTHSEVWLSEIGYDAWPEGLIDNSAVNAPPIEALPGNDGPYDSQKVQAQWLTRVILESAASEVVDKVMLYELYDEPGLGGTYEYSGLIRDDGTKKRSWYYIMTQKFLIGDYTFNQEVQDLPLFDVDPGNNDVRVYEFRQGDGICYAIWSPTAEARNPFTVEFTIPNTPTYPNTIGSVAQVARIVELSERGQIDAADVTGRRITVEGVSETPLYVFLQADHPISSYNNTHVLNFDCASDAACCGSTTLTWDTPPKNNGNVILAYQIYYREHTGGANCPAFDITQCTLYPNNLGPDANKVNIRGLDANKEYCFYILPINRDGLVPDLDNVPAVQCSPTPSNCNDCFIDILPSQIIAGNFQADAVATMTGIGSCAVLEADCQGYSQFGGGEILINFDIHKYINSIYLQDGTGNGTVEIEVKNCCGTWSHLSTLDLLGDWYCQTAAPVAPWRIDDVNRSKIKAIRITVSGGGGFTRLFFCGGDDSCTSGNPGNGEALKGPNNGLLVNGIEPHSAVLQWDYILREEETLQNGFFDSYAIAFSQTIDELGSLIDPIIQYYEEDNYIGFQRLEGLAPNTEYFVEIYPTEGLAGPPGSDCAGLREGYQTSFITKGDGFYERSEAIREDEEKKAFKVFMNPNPVKNQTSVSIEGGQLKSLKVLSVEGRTVKELNGLTGEATMLDVSDLAHGYYWLRVRTQSNKVQTVGFVKLQR